MKIKVNFLKNMYLAILLTVFFLTFITPKIVHSGASSVAEEYVEGSLIIFLFFIGYSIMWLYRKKIGKIDKKLSAARREKTGFEDKLNDAFRHIGDVNVQIDAIRSALTEIGKYPDNKQEMKQVMELLATAVLKIVSADWALLRIIDTQNSRTLREAIKSRGSHISVKHEISNKNLINKKSDNGYTVVSSNQEGMVIKTFCVLPKIKLKKEQKIMLKTIVNQAEMLFIIFGSKYYKQRRDGKNILIK